jgi:hypothetical protein
VNAKPFFEGFTYTTTYTTHAEKYECNANLDCKSNSSCSDEQELLLLGNGFAMGFVDVLRCSGVVAR